MILLNQRKLPCASLIDKWATANALHSSGLSTAVLLYFDSVSVSRAVSAGDYFPPDAHGTLVCHNDLGLANTIVHPDRPEVVGFIDFDYSRPVDRLFDIAVAARHWVPFGSLDMATPLDLDRVGRFHLFCDQHELSANERCQVVDLAIGFLEHARSNIKNLAEQGKPGFAELIANGYEQTNIAIVDWIDQHREQLALRTHG